MNSEGDREVKEVLVIFDSRRRPVKFVCYRANPYETYQSLFNAVEKAFCDVLAAEEGSSTSEGGFFLQVESKEWGGMIDVTAETRVDDHSTVFLCKTNTSRCEASSIGDASPSKKVLYLN